MLILSPEAIYVFQYLALMREPAQDYLQSMLILVNSNLDSLVPSLVLGTTQNANQLPLEFLFAKIAKTTEVNFFAAMLD